MRLVISSRDVSNLKDFQTHPHLLSLHLLLRYHTHSMGFQFAEVATEIEAARLLTYNAARLKESGQPFTKQAAMSKLYSSNVAQKACGMAIEWAGGVGFTREVGIEKFWRDSKWVMRETAGLDS